MQIKGLREQEIIIARHYTQSNEAFSPTRYLCTKKKDTIGFGHKIATREERLKYHDDYTMTLKEADSLFDIDFAKHAALAAKLPEYEVVNAARRIVLIDMVFQMGFGRERPKEGVMGFTDTRRLLRAQRFMNAAVELKDSKYFRIDSPERAQRSANIIELGRITSIPIVPIAGLSDDENFDRIRVVRDAVRELKFMKAAV